MEENKKAKISSHKTICMPFYKTGHCGYGSECIYLHIREDDLDLKLDDISFKNMCNLCKKETTDGVYTECNHIYCLECVLDYSEKESKCYVCKLNTFGRFYPIN